MKTKILITTCLLGQLLIAQTEQKKPLADFTKLNANVSSVIYLQKSDAPYVSMQQDSGSNIKTDVVDGTLMIRSGKNGEMPSKITIGYVTLNGIEGNGAVSIKSGEVITANTFDVDLNGAAKCKLDITATTISCIVNGAATASLNGTCNKIEATISGAAFLKAENLVAENANINTSGAATAKVNVTNKLEGNASGASSLKFTGNPKETQINQSGASSIKKIDISGNTETTATSTGDSTRRYTINSRYEIIVHEKKSDTTSFYKKHNNRLHKKNWAGVDLFENGYLTPDNNITLPSNQDYMSPNYGGRNLGFNLNMFEKDFRFAKGHLQIVTGLGFSFNYYNLKNKTVLKADSSYTGYSYNSSASYSKNKLRESFITVPLLLELNTSKRDSRNFHIAAGVIGGLKLGSSTKQKYSLDGHNIDEVKDNSYNLFPFKLDATVRVGYGDFTLFATYSLTPLFEYGKGPELYPFSVGIRIIPF